MFFDNRFICSREPKWISIAFIATDGLKNSQVVEDQPTPSNSDQGIRTVFIFHLNCHFHINIVKLNLSSVFLQTKSCHGK
jgi:hypothetical protein